MPKDSTLIDIFISLLIFVIALLVFGIIHGLFLKGASQVVLIESVYQMLAVSLSVAYLYRKYPIKRETYGFSPKVISPTLMWGLYGGILLVILNYPYGLFSKNFPVFLEKHTVEYVTPESGVTLIIIHFVIVSILIPVIEEVFYRGLIYRIAKDRFNYFWGTIIATSIYAVGHKAVFFTTISSIILILIYEKSNYLGSCIFSHIIWNSMLYGILYLKIL